MRFQSEEVRQESISATAKFDGFQTRIETSLLFVEQTIEEQNGGLEFIGRDLKSGDIGHDGNRLSGSPR